jgi:hypothetical protein
MVNYSGAYAAPRLDLGAAFMEYAMQLNEFIGLQVLPLFRTPKKAASFSAITRETLTQDPEAARAAKSGYNRINVGAKDKSYECFEYGLEGVVDDSERALYQSDFDAENATSLVVGRALMLQHEQRVAAAVFDTAVWTGASLYTDHSAAPWDTATSDVIGHVRDAKEKVRQNSGMRANALILSAAQLNSILVNDDVIARFPGAPIVTEEMLRANLAAIFGLERLIVGGAVENSAIEGQTFSGADIWTDDYAMVAVVASDGAPLQTPCIGRTFLWTPDSPSDMVVEMYREEQVRGDVVRYRHTTDELIIDANFGHLMKID